MTDITNYEEAELAAIIAQPKGADVQCVATVAAHRYYLLVAGLIDIPTVNGEPRVFATEEGLALLAEVPGQKVIV